MKYQNMGFVLGALLALSACEQPPKSYSFAEANKICEEKRRDAQGPRTDVTVGANSRTGPFTNVSISLTDSYLRGADPNEVYDQCMASLNIRQGG